MCLVLSKTAGGGPWPAVPMTTQSPVLQVLSASQHALLYRETGTPGGASVSAALVKGGIVSAPRPSSDPLLRVWRHGTSAILQVRPEASSSHRAQGFSFPALQPPRTFNAPIVLNLDPFIHTCMHPSAESMHATQICR